MSAPDWPRCGRRCSLRRAAAPSSWAPGRASTSPIIRAAGDRAHPGRARPAYGQATAGEGRGTRAGPADRGDRGARRGAPFDDASFDTVVDPCALHGGGPGTRALAEARRVLSRAARCSSSSTCAPSAPAWARWQDRLERPWGWIAGGCHPNRATDESIAAAGFWIERLDRGKFPGAPPPIRPMISGDGPAPGLAGARLSPARGLTSVRRSSSSETRSAAVPVLPGRLPHRRSRARRRRPARVGGHRPL